MKNILFVDDEPDILDGLRNVLRSERASWNMRFVLGAQAALSALDEQPFDVIVTDMRMPGMDGLTLLGHVRVRHPQVARIVLSGSTDLALVAGAASVAHQFLLKPCEAEALRIVIHRALNLQVLLANTELRKVVGGLGSLPSMPTSYLALTAALADPDVEIRKVGAIVRQDVGLATRVLQFVNSAYCGFAQRISSIESAIACLGLNSLRHLALSVEVFRSFAGPAGSALEKLERHALLTARIARKLTPDPSRAEPAFAAGLLHDVGKLVLMTRAPDAYQRVLDEVRRSSTPCFVVERQVFGASHAEIGAYLLGLWDLPHEILEPVAYHHSLERVGQNGIDTLAAVALADALAYDAAEGVGGHETREVLERLAALGDLGRWRDLALATARAA